VTQAAFGALFAAIAAAVAYRARALTAGGALAAFAVGTVVFASGGWPAAAVLFAFFLPSTILSRIGKDRKRALSGAAATSVRSAWQVLANGGVAALCALLAASSGASFTVAFAGAFAAASADTWGSELGMLSQRPPVSILTLRPLRPGMSGGVTLLGLAATLGGASCVALVAAMVRAAPFGAVALGGIAGALIDSALGASLQARRWCPACSCEAETRRHYCGSATTLRSGESWLENDGVNFAATLCGAIVAAILVTV
jgi:uncharacterized protein (TIGR00297 family)